MAKKRPARRTRRKRTRSWFTLRNLSMLIATGTFIYYTAFSYFGVPDEKKAQIFAVYADLNITPSTLRRMQESPLPITTKPASVRWQTITRVVDGDTVEVDGEKIRLIGVDTPESSQNNELFRDVGKMRGICTPEELVAMGKEATRAIRRLAEGRGCWLEFEQERTDMYGRALAYVHLEDGSILNELVLSEGYGKVYLSSKFKYKKRYIYLQLGAMTKRKGFWKGEETGM